MNKKKKAKKIFGIIMAVGGLASLAFVPWLLVKAWILPLPDSVQAQADQAIDHGLDGVIIYVDKAGEAPVSYASGWHDKELQIPARTDAYFKIASIAKLFTAVAITKLVSAGELSLDENLGHYMPELVGRIEYADEITLRHLIGHRSGIPNYSDTDRYWESTKTPEEDLALILDQPANFKPGESYEYCNTNYLLLGKIIEQKTEGWFSFIQEQVLTPLNMKNTYASIYEVNLDEVMGGYHVGYPHNIKESDYGMVSTAEDIGKFIRALNNGDMFVGNEDEIYSSIYEKEHDGWVPGYQSFARYDEDMDAVIVLFNNTTDPKLILWNLSEIIHSRVAKIVRNN